MIEKLKDFFKKGLFHIIGSNAINKVIAFVANLILVRILSKAEFGIFSGAFNVFSIVFLFSGLGINNGVLYFCSQKRSMENKKEYYNYCFKVGNIVNAVLCGILLVYGLIVPAGISEARQYIILLAGMPLAGFWYEFYSIVLRTQKENKKYALLLNVNSILYASLAILGSLVAGITGTILGRYLANIISAFLGCHYSREYLYSKEEERHDISADAKKPLYSYSIKAGLSSAFNNILYLLDVYIIGIVIADATILASYKVGAQIPENMNFLPQSMMAFFLPVFIENAGNHEWLKKRTKELYLSMAAIAFVLSAVLIILAPYVITILFGSQYVDAVPCFRIMTVSFFFLSTFRLTSTNILLSLGKAGYTLMISIVSGVANIILAVTMTVNFGSLGAAYATLIVTLIASALSFPYVIHVIKNMNRETRVMEGVREIAGQAYYSAKGLKENGVKADAVFWEESPYKYPYDKCLKIPKGVSILYPWYLLKMLGYTLVCIVKYDVFHLHCRKSLLPKHLDLPILKMFGKKIYFEYHGTEIRRKSIACEQNPNWAGVDMPDEKALLKSAKQLLKYADGVIIHDDELLPHFPEGCSPFIVPLRMDIEELTKEGSEPHDRLTILHAPTDSAVKGSAFVNEAVEELKKKYDFDYIQVQGLPQEEAKKLYRRADIVVDQLLMGTYGVFAIEMMALGKPVIAYLTDEMKESFPEDLPVISATTTDIKDVLEDLIVNEEKRKEIGEKGAAYVRKYHDCRRNAQVLFDIFTGKLTESLRGREAFAYAASKELPAEVASELVADDAAELVLEAPAEVAEPAETPDEVTAEGTDEQ